MTHPADADARPVRRWVGGLAVTAAVGIAVGLAAGWAVLALTRPSDDDLQRAVLDEVGLPAELEAAPVVGPALDPYTDRIERRVLDETRPSATLALSVIVIVIVIVTVAARAAQSGSTPRMIASPTTTRSWLTVVVTDTAADNETHPVPVHPVGRTEP